MSVAGKRAGLDGERSGLFFEFVRIIREMREASDGRFPKYVLVENVPGLLSSDSGRDFGVVLNELAQCGAVDIAWRIIDSQHWVPQRRRRVFIVACFAPVAEPGAAIGRAAEVLSLCESCGGHPAAGRAAGEDVANPLGASVTSFGGQRYDLDHETYIPDVSPALTQRDYKSQREDIAEPAFIAVRTAQTSANGHGIAEMSVYDGSAAVRRLTPTECSRLQGFPDNWLHGADGPRYRALGNAVTVPVAEYLGRRIMAVDA